MGRECSLTVSHKIQLGEKGTVATGMTSKDGVEARMINFSSEDPFIIDVEAVVFFFTVFCKRILCRVETAYAVPVPAFSFWKDFHFADVGGMALSPGHIINYSGEFFHQQTGFWKWYDLSYWLSFMCYPCIPYLPSPESQKTLASYLRFNSNHTTVHKASVVTTILTHTRLMCSS